MEWTPISVLSLRFALMAKGRQLVEFDSLDAELRLWFLALFHRDIQEAERAAVDALVFAMAGQDDRDPDSMYCRCHDAAVVRYARCFLGCVLPDGTRKTRLPDRYKVQGQLETMHSQIMAARHSLVAHADLRERSVTLTRHRDAEAERWSIAASNGNLPPSALRIFVSLCRILKKTVIRELRPLIEERISDMKPGQTVNLASEKGGDVYWTN